MAFPWDGSWDVVILDPAGQVVTRSSADREADVERAGRAALREVLAPGAAAVELCVATSRPVR